MREIKDLGRGDNFFVGSCSGGLTFSIRIGEGLSFIGGHNPNGHFGEAEIKILPRWDGRHTAIGCVSPNSRSYVIGLWKGTFGELVRWVEGANQVLATVGHPGKATRLNLDLA